MKRFSLLMLINALLLILGGLVVLEGWDGVPTASKAIGPEIAALDKGLARPDIEAWKQAIGSGRDALLTGDKLNVKAIDAQRPEMARFAKGFDDFENAQEHAAEFKNEMANGAVNQAVANWKPGEVLAALKAPNIVAHLARPGAINANNIAALGKLPEPYQLAVARTALINAAGSHVDQLLAPAQRDVEDSQLCADLCNVALRQLGDAQMNGKRQGFMTRLAKAQEEIDWHVASNMPPGRGDKQAIQAYQLYLQTYGVPAKKPFALHIDKAEHELAVHTANAAWDDLLPTLPREVAGLVNNPQQELPKDLNGAALGSAVLALHKFCVDHPVDKNREMICRRISTRLLQYMFENDAALAPRVPSELMTVRRRRLAADFVGFLVKDETNDEVVTMTDERNKSKRRFFQAGLVAAPEYIEESQRERKYIEEFDKTRNLLANFDWNRKPILDFRNTCQELGFENRVAVVAQLQNLVGNCGKFDALAPKVAAKVAAQAAGDDP